LQLFGPRFTEQYVVDVARFLANQVSRFFLFLALGHGFSKLASEYSSKGYEGCVLCKSIAQLASSTRENPPFERVSEPKDRKNI
jgi:hypothetical protein